MFGFFKKKKNRRIYIPQEHIETVTILMDQEMALPGNQRRFASFQLWRFIEEVTDQDTSSGTWAIKGSITALYIEEVT